MTHKQKDSNTSGNQPSSKSGSNHSHKSSTNSVSQIEKSYAGSNLSSQIGVNKKQPQNGVIMTQPQNNSTQQQPVSSGSSQQRNQAQTMAYETGLEYTSNVIRKEKLNNKNQKATDSLVDRMYWQHEESLSKSINVNDKGELEDYDDTPGLTTNDKPGV